MMLEIYTGWLREHPRAAHQLSINPTKDKGAIPYQWKITSADGLKLIGYLIFDGPLINGTSAERRAHLYSLLDALVARKGIGNPVTAESRVIPMITGRRDVPKAS